MNMKNIIIIFVKIVWLIKKNYIEVMVFIILSLVYYIWLYEGKKVREFLV